MPRLFDRRNVSRLTNVTLAAFWVAMFVATHWPTTPSFVHDNNDKIWHFLGYTALAALCAAAWGLSRPGVLKPFSLKNSVVIVLVILAYGAFDEITQPVVGRTCDIRDWTADLLGACAGTATVQWLLLVAGKLLPGYKLDGD